MNCRSKGILLVISGFAGTGKGTLVQELLKRYDNYALSVSATTRDPRPGKKMVFIISLKQKKNLSR